jgi:hypothetical protein
VQIGSRPSKKKGVDLPAKKRSVQKTDPFAPSCPSPDRTKKMKPTLRKTKTERGPKTPPPPPRPLQIRSPRGSGKFCPPHSQLHALHSQLKNSAVKNFSRPVLRPFPGPPIHSALCTMQSPLHNFHIPTLHYALCNLHLFEPTLAPQPLPLIQT